MPDRERSREELLEEIKNLQNRVENLEEAVTLHGRVENILGESENLMHLVFDFSPSCVFVKDDRGRFILVNKRMAKLYRTIPAMMLGKTDEDFAGLLKKEHKEICNFSEEESKTADSAGLGVIAEEYFTFPNGTIKVFQTTKIPLTVKDKTVYLLGVSADITERKRIEDKLTLAYSELKRTNIQLVQSEKMAGIGQLAAGVAHEINNPLFFVITNLELLKQHMNIFLKVISDVKLVINRLYSENKEKFAGVKEFFEDAVKKIEIEPLKKELYEIVSDSIEGAARIKKIVESLRAISHPGMQEFQYADVNDLLEKSLTIVWGELKQKCDVTKDFQKVPKILCDPGGLSQVFVNIFMNAFQAMEDGKRGDIIIKTYPSDENIIIKISDTGKGIAPEQINRIFDPFFTTKPVGKGTGLGLSIVYNIINKHNGIITVSSELGKGTTFVIKLPAKSYDR